MSKLGVLVSASSLVLAAAGVTACGPDCTDTLTCGDGGEDDGAGAAGGATSTGGATTTGVGASSAGGNGTGGVGGTPAVGGMGGAGGQTSTGGGGGAAPVVPASLGLGSAQSCAAFTDGTTKCWGSNSYGQLGDGTTTDSSVPVLTTLGDVAHIDSGYQHTCALKNDGTVWCVGRNTQGQLGDGTNADSTAFVQVIGITNATAISVDGNVSCARLADATARCWGAGTDGQLGNGTATNSNVPVVFQESNVAQISCGNGVVCARLGTGAVHCSGLGQQGQLGNGSQNDSATPVAVSGVGNAVAISTVSTHSCVVRTTGVVSCWGIDVHGEVGDGSAGGVEATPVDVVSLSGGVDVAVMYDSSCALLNDGTIRCWGRNDLGQLGNGQMVDTASPVQVLGLNAANQLAAAGGGQACVLNNNDQVLCWGSNYKGQLGNGNTTDSSQPIMVTGL